MIVDIIYGAYTTRIDLTIYSRLQIILGALYVWAMILA
jgi:hypothetical protein